MGVLVTATEAKEFLAKYWPDKAAIPTLEVKGQVHKVVAKDGSELAAAFSWKPALAAAFKPHLDAEAKAQAEAAENQRKDFIDFHVFLKEYLNDAFQQWKAKRAAQAKPALGAEPDQGKLVQIIQP